MVFDFRNRRPLRIRESFLHTGHERENQDSCSENYGVALAYQLRPARRSNAQPELFPGDIPQNSYEVDKLAFADGYRPDAPELAARADEMVVLGLVYADRILFSHVTGLYSVNPSLVGARLVSGPDERA